MDISLLSPDTRQVPVSPVMSYRSAAAVVGMSGALATGRNISYQNPGESGVELGVEPEEMEEQEVAIRQVEQGLEESGEEEEGEEEEEEEEQDEEEEEEEEEEREGRRRKVKFRKGAALVAEFDDSNLWARDPNETAQDMVNVYRQECSAMRVRPITKLLEQLERVDDLTIPIDTLDLKGVRLDSRSCEVLEAVLSRMQMGTLDLERTNLEDEGVIALCEMIEFYGCASRIVLSSNNRLRPRAWLTIGRMLKKSPFIHMINVSYCGLEEQTITLLLRSVRANCALQVLKMQGNNLSGKGTFILMAAMKFNENLQELWLGSNHLGPEDGQHLGSILRTNHTLRVLDLRENNLQDAGVRYICAGVAEQQEGLQVLNLLSNNIGQEGFHHISAMLPCTKSLRELVLSHNRCGDSGLFMLKLGLLANRSIEKLVLSNTKMTCEGAIALAEVLAESRHITHVDLKENDIRVAGLMALQLAHRMNHVLLSMETPKAYRVEPRDRPLIKSLRADIDRYCARNLQQRESQLEVERRHLHEAQHSQQEGRLDEVAPFTAGGTKEEEKEVDPALVGSLDDVYLDEPGAMMREDPFQGKVMDDKEKPASLMELEKSIDALAVYSDEESSAADSSNLDSSSLDRGVRVPRQRDTLTGCQVMPQEGLELGQPPDLQSSNRPVGEELPDVVGVASHAGTDGPDVASLPLDVAAGTQRSVDLLGEARQSDQDSWPVDLTDGLDSQGT